MVLIFIFCPSLQEDKIFWPRRGGAEAYACMHRVGHGRFQALTIHLHLIKFSLLLPGTSAVTAPTLIKNARIFCSSWLEFCCPARHRFHTLWERLMLGREALATGSVKCLLLRCRRLWGDFGLLCQLQPNQVPRSPVLPHVPVQGSALRCLHSSY